VRYLYPEWADVDSQSHEARMERLRDWQQEYLESLAGQEELHFIEWEGECAGLHDWLALYQEETT